ncbi:hypothetical protein SNARM312S_07978 [Streptomyces narbonensis]
MTAGSFPETAGRASVPFHAKGLLDVLGVAAIVIDARGRVVLWSPQAETLGYRADEALGRYIARLIVGAEHREEALRLFGEVLRGGATWAGTFPVRHKDGSTREVEFRNMRLTDDLGGLYALGIAADRAVVERVETGLALSDRLVSESPIGLAVLDTDLRYVLVNPALERINGVPAELHIGHRIAEICRGSTRRRWRRRCARSSPCAARCSTTRRRDGPRRTPSTSTPGRCPSTAWTGPRARSWGSRSR